MPPPDRLTLVKFDSVVLEGRRLPSDELDNQRRALRKMVAKNETKALKKIIWLYRMLKNVLIELVM
jgi:ATP-dependent DNA ligase